jgi:hypothetical protein
MIQHIYNTIGILGCLILVWLCLCLAGVAMFLSYVLSEKREEFRPDKAFKVPVIKDRRPLITFGDALVMIFLLAIALAALLRHC